MAGPVFDVSKHPKQAAVLKSKARFIAAIAGKQGGKTTVGVMWFVREIKESHDRGEKFDFLVCGPTNKILQQSAVPRLLDVINQLGWGEYKEGKSQFELSWGPKIFVRSAEDPDAIESMTVKAVWIDEAGKIAHKAFSNARARTTTTKGRMLLTTTPYASNWLEEYVWKRAWKINGEIQPNDAGLRQQDTEVFNWTSVDNPAFTREEYESLRASMSEEAFERDYKGLFTRLEGLVYRHFDPIADVVKPFAIPPEWRRFGGADFGHSSPTAIESVAEKPEERSPDGKLVKPSEFYVFREFYKKEPLLREIADYLKLHNHAYTLGDPRNAQEMAELKRAHGVRGIMPAVNNVEVGVERIKVLFKEHRIKIFSNCVNTIDELKSYHYHEDSIDKPVKDAPVKLHDHAMDALKYAFSRDVGSIYEKQPEVPEYHTRNLTNQRMIRRERLQDVDPITGYF